MTIAERLRIVPEFRPDEYDRITEIVSGKLDRRLKRWDAEQVELEISVKERDTDQQRVTLECWIAGLPKLVATSDERRLDDAVAAARDGLFTQIDTHLGKKEAARRR